MNSRFWKVDALFMDRVSETKDTLLRNLKQERKLN